MFKFLRDQWITLIGVRYGKCPWCFKRLYSFSDYGVEYGYCPKHNDIAYYEDGWQTMKDE